MARVGSGCQRVRGGGKSWLLCLSNAGLFCLAVDGLFKPLSPAVVLHQTAQLEPVANWQADAVGFGLFGFHAASVSDVVPRATQKYFQKNLLTCGTTGVQYTHADEKSEQQADRRCGSCSVLRVT